MVGGNDPASEVYVARKISECRKVGIRSIEHRLPRHISESDLFGLIVSVNSMLQTAAGQKPTKPEGMLQVVAEEGIHRNPQQADFTIFWYADTPKYPQPYPQPGTFSTD